MHDLRLKERSTPGTIIIIHTFIVLCLIPSDPFSRRLRKSLNDVIKMRDEERRSGKEKPIKKIWIIPRFYDVTC